MERLTFRTDLGLSVDKNEDCPTCSICWNCDIKVKDCKYFSNVLEKLAKYEDAEEQGLLLKLPCKVGDTVYEISLVKPYRNPAIREMGVVDILLRDDDMYFTLQDLHDADYDNSILSTEFGKTVFLTEVEAEQAVQQALDKLSNKTDF